jgi:hypothetical protein
MAEITGKFYADTRELRRLVAETYGIDHKVLPELHTKALQKEQAFKQAYCDKYAAFLKAC